MQFYFSVGGSAIVDSLMSAVAIFMNNYFKLVFSFPILDTEDGMWVCRAVLIGASQQL
jgi:hypothetical protein